MPPTPALTAARAPRASWPKPLTPSSGDGERSSLGLSRPSPPHPPLNTGSSSNTLRTIVRRLLPADTKKTSSSGLRPRTRALNLPEDARRSTIAVPAAIPAVMSDNYLLSTIFSSSILAGFSRVLQHCPCAILDTVESSMTADGQPFYLWLPKTYRQQHYRRAGHTNLRRQIQSEHRCHRQAPIACANLRRTMRHYPRLEVLRGCKRSSSA